MTPLLKKAAYAARPLFDPAPSTIHIYDLIHMDHHYTDRTSDYVTGMLMLAAKAGIVTKVEACYFQVPFTIGVKLRKSLYQHEGQPFLGPDDTAVQIGDRIFGGGSQAPGGAYTLDNVHADPGYDAWLAQVLFRGTTKEDSDFHRSGTVAPKRHKDGSLSTTLAGPSNSAVPSSSTPLIGSPTAPDSAPGNPHASPSPGAGQRCASDALDDSSLKRSNGTPPSSVVTSKLSLSPLFLLIFAHFLTSSQLRVMSLMARVVFPIH